MIDRAKKRIDGKQIARIHVLVSALGMPDEGYRQTLMHNFGVATSKALTSIDAAELIEALEERAIENGVWKRYEGRSKYEKLGHRPGMATPPQLRKIEALWKGASRIRDIKAREKGLRAFLLGHFKVSDLRFLPMSKVSKVICALEHMQKDRRNEPF